MKTIPTENVQAAANCLRHAADLADALIAGREVPNCLAEILDQPPTMPVTLDMIRKVIKDSATLISEE